MFIWNNWHYGYCGRIALSDAKQGICIFLIFTENQWKIGQCKSRHTGEKEFLQSLFYIWQKNMIKLRNLKELVPLYQWRKVWTFISENLSQHLWGAKENFQTRLQKQKVSPGKRFWLYKGNVLRTLCSKSCFLVLSFFAKKNIFFPQVS